MDERASGRNYLKFDQVAGIPIDCEHCAAIVTCVGLQGAPIWFRHSTVEWTRAVIVAQIGEQRWSVRGDEKRTSRNKFEVPMHAVYLPSAYMVTRRFFGFLRRTKRIFASDPKMSMS